MGPSHRLQFEARLPSGSRVATCAAALRESPLALPRRPPPVCISDTRGVAREACWHRIGPYPLPLGRTPQVMEQLGISPEMMQAVLGGGMGGGGGGGGVNPVLAQVIRPPPPCRLAVAPVYGACYSLSCGWRDSLSCAVLNSTCSVEPTCWARCPTCYIGSHVLCWTLRVACELCIRPFAIRLPSSFSRFLSLVTFRAPHRPCATPSWVVVAIHPRTAHRGG